MPTCIIAGVRNSWKRARNGFQEIRPGEATSDEVKDLRAEAVALKEALAESVMETRLLKKSMIGDGGDDI